MKIQPYKRIVVEGMDGSGKTTLIKHLEMYIGERLEFVQGYNRITAPKSPISQWWMEQLGLNPVGKIIVHDRFFYPELVYGPILRGKIATDRSTQTYVTEFLRKHAFLIYCRPPNTTIEDGFKVEPQMEGVKPNFWNLLVAYDRLMIEEGPHYNGRFVRYDWTDEKALGKLVQRLTGYIY